MERRREGSTKLRNIHRENEALVPERQAIEALPPLGDETFAMDLSGLSLKFSGLNAPLAGAFRARFAAYACPPDAAPSPLEVSLHRDAVEYYVTPEATKSEGYYRLKIVCEKDLLRFVTYSMAAFIDLGASRAGVAFGRGTFDPRERALENFCRLAVAWMSTTRGGFFIHGASIVRRGRAYIFFGKSASGKSTLAKMNTEGQVVSDDLTLVLPGAGGYAVAGSPFRGTYEGGGPVRGLFPLAGIFRLVQDERTFVETPPRALAFGEFIANLPFINESLNLRPALFDSIEKAASSIPILFLHFRTQPDYWPAVDEALAARG